MSDPRVRPSWWRSPHWRKTPLVLAHHRSALVAVALSGFLVALAAASAPFVTTAAASAALKNKLVDLAPLATGLEISGRIASDPAPRALGGLARRRERAASRLSADLGLERPIFTVESPMPGAALNGNGDTRLTLMARSDALRHVRIIAQTHGHGVWISDVTARTARLDLGGVLRIQYSTIGHPETRTVGLRVKGIYRALDLSAPDPYWANFLQDIFPPGVDPPPPQRFVFMAFRDLYRTTRALSTITAFRNNGQTFRAASGPQLTAHTEMAVDQRRLTLARAHALTRRLDALEPALEHSALGRDLGCAASARPASPADDQPVLCSISSSLSSAVALADANAAAVSPIVSLLSGAGIGITLAVAGAAGAFLVRRRRAEAALLFARGEPVATFAVRSLAELLLPMLAGAATGFAAALGLTQLFAPTGSIDAGTVTSAATHALIATAAGLALAVGAAAVVFVHLFDTGTVERRWLRRLPWELLLLGSAGWLLHDVLTGGGFARSAEGSGGHPTLAVFLVPLVLVAAAAGLTMRFLRLILARPGTGARLPTPLFLALRRALASRAVLTALVVVTAVCFGAYFYAESLAASVERSVADKAYIAYGGDVQGFVAGSTPVPRRYRYPLTRVEWANQAATIGDGGTPANVMVVDPASLGSVIPWYRDWGPDQRPRLHALLADSPSGTLPAIVTRSVPDGTAAITLQGIRVPIRVVSRVSAFPGMSVNTPLVVVARKPLDAAAKRAHLIDPLGVTQTYMWAKGPPRQVARALEAPPIQASFVATVDEFRHDPDVLLATRAFTYLRLIAAAAGVLVFIGLLLYLQARQRSQSVESALAARMGLRRGAETLSISVELAAIALVAALLGGVVAVLTAKPIVGHVDPLPDHPPVPAPALPITAIVLAVLALLMVAFAAGALTSWLSRRADASEALRVA